MEAMHVKTSDCGIGDIIANDVTNPYGVKLISRGTVINDYIIKRLMEIGIEDVVVYNQNSIEMGRKECREAQEKVSYCIDSVRQILNELASGKGLDYSKLSCTSDYILKVIDEGRPVTEYLNELKGSDEYTYSHCVNVAFYSMLLAKWLRMPKKDIKKAIEAGLLHDIGKTKVPLAIINKKGYLTKEEYQEIKKHSQYGYEILSISNVIDKDIKEAVLMHHERADGSGYPFGAKYDSINIYAKIVAITDVFDAMTTDRIYKKKVTPFDVFELFITTGDSIFDAIMLRTFVSNLAPLYAGTQVALDNGEYGEIVFVPPYDITDPIIKVKNELAGFINGKGRIVSIT